MPAENFRGKNVASFILTQGSISTSTLFKFYIRKMIYSATTILI